jgi:hypothetical protein
MTDYQTTPTGDRALTFTRYKGLSVAAADCPTRALARPTSLHGCAVACKRLGTKYGRLVVLVNGEPICPSAKFALEPKWRQYLP